MSPSKSFWFLIILFIFLRLFPVFWDNFPYAYDNAKDSLVVMEMWYSKKPALLGAVTSLEGLWQGPFWYYVLFPLNLLSGFHPFSSVLMVVLLGVFTLWLMWKYVGRLEAFLFTVSSLVITTHQTAWSPYLAMFPAVWVLVFLLKMKTKVRTLDFVLMCASLSVMFHAEIAFAVVFLVLACVTFVSLKLKLTLKQVLLGGMAFCTLFIPQIAFEIRHDFLQSRSVVRFITNFEEESAKVQSGSIGIGRVFEVLETFWDNAKRSVLPIDFETHSAFSILPFLLLLFFFFKFADKTSKAIVMPIILGSFIFYLFLPLKSFYLVGLTPFWIYAFAQVVKKSQKTEKIVFLVFLIVAILGAVFSRENYKKLAKETHVLFAPQKEAVEKAYEVTGGAAFNSYHYLPEVYDYVYQHIYQYTSVQKGRELPVEFSYAPGEVGYIQTNKLVSEATSPKYRVLIVEEDERKMFFDTWWNNLTRDKTILRKIDVNEAIKLYLLEE